jgi:hypothetical protein
MHYYIDGTRYLLMQCLFQTLGYFVGRRYIQSRVDQDMQIEKNLPADRSGSEFVPPAD